MAEMFVPTNWVYTVDQIKFTIDDVEYPVANLNFSYQHNGLPGVKIGLAASSRGVDSQIQSTDMAELVRYQNTIQAKVNTPGTKTYLEFKVVSAADTQSIKLEKWILQGAGIERLGVDGAVMVSALIMHPAYLARQSNLVIYNYPQEVEEPAAIVGDNVYQWFLESVRDFLDKMQSADSASENSSNVTQAMIANTRTALDALDAGVAWGGGTSASKYPFAFADDDDVLKGVIQTAIWNMAKIEGSNPLDGMLQMLGEYSLCLIGSFDDQKLQIVPFEPWSSRVGTVYEDEINTVEMPSEDPRPVAGVVMKYDGGVTGEFALLPPGYYTNEGGGVKMEPQNRTSVGAEVEKMADLLGELIVIGPPQWLLLYLDGPTDENVEYDLPGVNDEANVRNPGDPGAAADYTERLDLFKPLAENYCRQYFWTMYRAGVQISLITRFMLVNPAFPTPNNMVIPGITVTMASRATGSDDHLLYFFVDRVQHVIDAEGATAYTQLTGSFVRPSDGVYSTGKIVISPDEVTKGIRNPLWIDSAYKP